MVGDEWVKENLTVRLLIGGSVAAAVLGALLGQRYQQHLISKLNLQGSTPRSNHPRSLVPKHTARIFELKGEYYQVLGHAWDHEIKDFKVGNTCGCGCRGWVWVWVWCDVMCMGWWVQRFVESCTYFIDYPHIHPNLHAGCVPAVVPLPA